GTTVSLAAARAVGSCSSGCADCPSASGATCTVELKDATHISASFAPLPIPVTVAVTGSGAVASTPAGLSCGASCMASFPYGSTVTLTPTPAANHHFTGWTGACSGTGGCSFTVGIDPIVVGARFAIDTYALTVVDGDGGSELS